MQGSVNVSVCGSVLKYLDDVVSAIVYNILYEDVFKVPKVQDIVRGMLYDKEFVSMSFGQVNNADVKVKVEKGEKSEDVAQAINVAPFPFKVAKALDPTIYRNIEYDSWTEVRRGE